MATVIVGVSVLIGCAQKAVVVEQAPLNKWVQRDVVITAPDLDIEASEYVGVSSESYKLIGPEERVIWIRGVDPKISKLQRGSMPADAIKTQKSNMAFNLVSAKSFGVSNDGLSVEALFEIDKFTAGQQDRFYAEILNTGNMNERSVESGMRNWKDLLDRLKKRGLNLQNVTFGGAKFQQKTDAIVLVKVGS